MYFPVREVRILSGSMGNTFGWVRKNSDGTPRCHQGWDFQATNDTPMYAVCDGEVIRYDKTDNSSYGKSLLLKLDYWGEELYAFYAHINTSLVDKYQTVFAGDLIGYTGSTGNAKGSSKNAQHLHFEFRYKESCGHGLTGRTDPYRFYGPPPLSWSVATEQIFYDWTYGTPAY
jgi:murein DD-endopeptidase MepM/ murein hydrolase activator NlpD